MEGSRLLVNDTALRNFSFYQIEFALEDYHKAWDFMASFVRAGDGNRIVEIDIRLFSDLILDRKGEKDFKLKSVREKPLEFLKANLKGNELVNLLLEYPEAINEAIRICEKTRLIALSEGEKWPPEGKDNWALSFLYSRLEEYKIENDWDRDKLKLI